MDKTEFDRTVIDKTYEVYRKEKEFCLTDKIRRWMDYKERMLDVKDVKEFIKQLKTDFKNRLGIVFDDDVDEIIDKLAGEKLI